MKKKIEWHLSDDKKSLEKKGKFKRSLNDEELKLVKSLDFLAQQISIKCLGTSLAHTSGLQGGYIEPHQKDLKKSTYKENSDRIFQSLFERLLLSSPYKKSLTPYKSAVFFNFETLSYYKRGYKNNKESRVFNVLDDILINFAKAVNGDVAQLFAGRRDISMDLIFDMFSIVAKDIAIDFDLNASRDDKVSRAIHSISGEKQIHVACIDMLRFAQTPERLKAYHAKQHSAEKGDVVLLEGEEKELKEPKEKKYVPSSSGDTRQVLLRRDSGSSFSEREGKKSEQKAKEPHAKH
jgi:hypothetical protein